MWKADQRSGELMASVRQYEEIRVRRRGASLMLGIGNCSDGMQYKNICVRISGGIRREIGEECGVCCDCFGVIRRESSLISRL